MTIACAVCYPPSVSSFWVAAALAAALNQTPATAPKPQTPVTPPAAASLTPSRPANPFVNLLPNLGHDITSLASESTVLVMGVGGAGAIASHNNDARVHEWALRQPKGSGLAEFGNATGDAIVQGTAAIAIWVAGKQTGQARLESTGADLIRAQILNAVLTVPIKYAVNRERPNGGHHSFPSGHTSATFATAAVIQRDYGLAVSAPFYALGGIVGWSRVRTNHHWLSDGVFGAAIGITSGLAVTKGHSSKWSVVPVKTSGGGAIYVTRR
jgi:hypothetical protein